MLNRDGFDVMEERKAGDGNREESGETGTGKRSKRSG